MVPLLKKMVDGVERLVSNHLALARLEIGQDASALGSRVVELTMFVPLIVIGLGLIMTAIAIFLAPYLGLGWSLLLVGGVTAIAGTIGLWIAKNKVSHRSVLDDSGDEIKKTAKVIGAAGKPAELQKAE